MIIFLLNELIIFSANWFVVDGRIAKLTDCDELFFINQKSDLWTQKKHPHVHRHVYPLKKTRDCFNSENIIHAFTQGVPSVKLVWNL